MTVPQAIYLAAVTTYLILFLLFMRFFFWKAYADRNYWRRKPYLDRGLIVSLAEKKSRKVPFISVLVPARNEADVIAKTIDHMLALNYPSDRFEFIVATDEKELTQREEKLGLWIDQAVSFTMGLLPRGRLAPQARDLVLGALASGCIELCGSGVKRSTDLFHSGVLSPLSPSERARVVSEMAGTIILSPGRQARPRLVMLLRRLHPGHSEQQLREDYPRYLSLALTVALSYWLESTPAEITEQEKVFRDLWRLTRTGSPPVTADMASTLAKLLAGRVFQAVRAQAEAGLLREHLERIARDCLPTTQDIAEEKLRSLRRKEGIPAFKHVVVPFDFDGRLGGKRTGWAVPSTKGRALNFAIGFLHPESEMCGFYDAESRPDPDILLYVAFRRLGDGKKVRILQGPVFQVRNFYQMGPFCRIASLYQAVAHDWYMPALFRRLPFVGGTNLYAETELLRAIGGYDHSALTEDLELGARAYLLYGAWPEYLPYYSSEQTPPTFNAFFKQRLRWGTGHLQVMDKIRSDSGYPADRKKPLLRQLFIKGQVEWVVYQSATFIPPLVLTLWWRGWVDPYILPEVVRWILNGFSATYIAFTVYAYYRYMPYLDTWASPRTLLGKAVVVLQLFFLPMAAFFFPVPYSSAMVLKALGKHPKTWTKTPRTRE